MNNSEYKKEIINRTYKFSLSVVLFVRDISERDLSFQIIARQLIRSATSIGANIVEAQASPSRKDFSKFISYSLKSSNESRYWLALLRDTSIDKTKQDETTALLKECQEIAKILGSTILKLKGKK